MIARLLRDALGRVPQQSRVPSLDEDARAWSDRLARLAASTQRDPYLRQAPEIMAAGAQLAARTRAAAGYNEVAAALLGLLAGLQAPAAAQTALARARASLDAYAAALAAEEAEAPGSVTEPHRDELSALEAEYARLLATTSAHRLPFLTTAGAPGG